MNDCKPAKWGCDCGSLQWEAADIVVATFTAGMSWEVQILYIQPLQHREDWRILRPNNQITLNCFLDHYSKWLQYPLLLKVKLKMKEVCFRYIATDLKQVLNYIAETIEQVKKVQCSSTPMQPESQWEKLSFNFFLCCRMFGMCSHQENQLS